MPTCRFVNTDKPEDSECLAAACGECLSPICRCLTCEEPNGACLACEENP